VFISKYINFKGILRAFKSCEKMTNVYILQGDATDVNGLSLENSLLSDYQWLGRAKWNNGFGSTIEKGGTAGDPSTGGTNPPTIDYTNGVFSIYIYPMKYNLQHSHTIISSDNETRPTNSTYIIWRRTA
jgi:hypothetical protein